MNKTLLISCVFLLLSCGMEQKKISSSIIDAETLAIDPPPLPRQNNTFIEDSSNELAEGEVKLDSISDTSPISQKKQQIEKVNKSKKTVTPKRGLKSTNTKNSLSMYCGAQNKTGGRCVRKVRGGGRCWQH